MKIVLYFLLCLPFWSAAEGIHHEPGFQPGYSIEVAEQIDDLFQFDDVQAELIKEYSYARRRRMSFGPLINVPENLHCRIHWVFQKHQDVLDFYRDPQGTLADVAHCYRMTPF